MNVVIFCCFLNYQKKLLFFPFFFGSKKSMAGCAPSDIMAVGWNAYDNVLVQSFKFSLIIIAMVTFVSLYVRVCLITYAYFINGLNTFLYAREMGIS